MKISPTLASIIALGASALSANAATAYWSFQNSASNAANADISEQSGFAGIPSVTNNAGTGTSASTGPVTGGGVQYTGPISNTVYTGTSIGINNTSSGFALGWSTPASAGTSLTGAFFTITLNTTGLTDLSMNFDIRAATANTDTPAPGMFTSMEYSLNGTNWFTLGLTSPTWAHLTGSPWERETINLASVDAIENQANVQLRFTFENSGVAGATAANMNIRVDNLLITAVPEPTSALLAGSLATLALLVRRRA